MTEKYENTLQQHMEEWHTLCEIQDDYLDDAYMFTLEIDGWIYYIPWQPIHFWPDTDEFKGKCAVGFNYEEDKK